MGLPGLARYSRLGVLAACGVACVIFACGRSFVDEEDTVRAVDASSFDAPREAHPRDAISEPYIGPPAEYCGGHHSAIKKIVAAGAHTCVLREDRSVCCWGANNFGQLGIGTEGDAPLTGPEAVVGLPADIVAIGAGQVSTWALTSGGEVYEWGMVSDSVNYPTPTVVRGLTFDVQAIAGSSGLACATDFDQVSCWAQMVDGVPPPWPISGIAPKKVMGLAAAQSSACVLTEGGGVKCWGNGGYLGDGTRTNHLHDAVDVLGLSSGAITIAGGIGHACVIRDTGGITCWGDNMGGQLGVDLPDAGPISHSNAPVNVVGLAGPASVVAPGFFHTCALLSNEKAQCWGDNGVGQLGHDGVTQTFTPVDVEGLPGEAIDIVAGMNHNCVLLKDGRVACWGNNTSQEIGGGTKRPQSAPVIVKGL